ncbi:MAG: cytochrome c [Nannocystaceae bacterium]
MSTMTALRTVALRPPLHHMVALAAAWSCGDAPERFTEPIVLGGQQVSPEVLAKGARTYALYCVGCHAADGSGRSDRNRSRPVPPRDFSAAEFRYVSGPEGSLPTDEDLDATVRRGIPDNGMPAWAGLPEDDRHAVIQYLKTFSPRWRTEIPAAPKEAS